MDEQTAEREKELQMQNDILTRHVVEVLEGYRTQKAENAKLREELKYYKDSTILQVRLKATVEVKLLAHIKEMQEAFSEVASYDDGCGCCSNAKVHENGKVKSVLAATDKLLAEFGEGK